MQSCLKTIQNAILNYLTKKGLRLAQSQLITYGVKKPNVRPWPDFLMVCL